MTKRNAATVHVQLCQWNVQQLNVQVVREREREREIKLILLFFKH